MKLFSILNPRKIEKKRPTVADYKQEMLLKLGREQFKTLLKKGLQIPVALL